MIELLQKYPKAAKLVKEYYLEQLMKGLKEDLPEDFKTHVREIGVDDEKIAKLIEVNPHLLFYFFDTQFIFVNINPSFTSGFNWFEFNINNEEVNNPQHFDRRIDCELAAVKEAFNILESKLS